MWIVVFVVLNVLIVMNCVVNRLETQLAGSSECVSKSLLLCAAKGRTNLELREQFSLAEGVSQTMSGFKSRLLTRQSSPGLPTTADSATTGSSSAASATHVKVNMITSSVAHVAEVE